MVERFSTALSSVLNTVVPKVKKRSTNNNYVNEIKRVVEQLSKNGEKLRLQFIWTSTMKQ